MLNPPHTSSPPRHPEVGANAFVQFGEIADADPQERVDPDFTAIARSSEFRSLRRRLRSFVFPMSAVFLAWYLAYVLIAAYLPGFMSIRLVGEINVGLVMGVGQFASTVLITVGYLHFAGRFLDPAVTRLRSGKTAGVPR